MFVILMNDRPSCVTGRVAIQSLSLIEYVQREVIEHLQNPRLCAKH